MTVPKAKNKPLESSTQVTGQNEMLFKKEHKEIYDYFVKVLEVKAKLKESKGITDYFILAYKKILLTNVNPEKIRPLSEENFCQFLLSIFKEVREKKLAGEEDSKVKQVVEECLDDVRGTEAKDLLIKLVGFPLGIKIDPKNISGSFMDGVKEKIPFLGGDKKEEDEPLLSDQEMVTKCLRKVFLPILFSIASILIFGPTTLAIVAAVIGTIFAVKGGIEVLFSNNRPGTLYDPSSPDKDDTEKRA
ncbi:jg24721, partial [Pararge aegeria aegeria]